MTALRFRARSTFGGGGGGSKGIQGATAELFGQRAAFELCGSFDNDPYACKVYEYLTGSEQVCVNVREMTPGMVREIFGAFAPWLDLGSPPCQGGSKLLSTEKSKTPYYVALNELALVNLRLTIEAWAPELMTDGKLLAVDLETRRAGLAKLPALILFENVPNITARAKPMLAEVRRILRAVGYVLQDGFHECRHVGNLAQRRKRWFLLARNPERVPAFVYLPPHRPGLVCGDVLNPLPMPGDLAGGPMHELPAISALNWWRLWAIPAGGDWRDLLPPDGKKKRERFRRHGVERWNSSSATIGGPGSNGPCAIEDPRPEAQRVEGPCSAPPLHLCVFERRPGAFTSKYKVTAEGEEAGTVTSASDLGQGAPSYAAPAPKPLDLEAQRGNAGMHWDKYAVRPWNREALTVHSATRLGSGAPAVAHPLTIPDTDFHQGSGVGRMGVLTPDAVAGTIVGNARVNTGPFSYASAVPIDLVPRAECFDKGYAVIDRDREPSNTIAGTASVGCGTYAITDHVPGAAGQVPLNLALGCEARAGAYGVIDPASVSPTVIASAKIDNSASAIAAGKHPPYVVLSYAEAKRVADGDVTVPFAIVDRAHPDEPLAIVDDMAKPPYRWIETTSKRGKVTRRKVVVPLVLISADGTWHRPLTTLELAVLQGLRWQHRGKPLDFGGGATAQRRTIGNMIPEPVAKVFGGQFLAAALASAAGASFLYGGGGGLWVRPEHAAMLIRSGVRRVRQQDLAKVADGEVVLLDDAAPRLRSRSTKPRVTVHDALAILRRLNATKVGASAVHLH